MSIFVLPYNSASASAKLLATALGATRLRTTNSRYRYRDGDVIICWGNTGKSLTREMNRAIIFNRPDAVSTATNKVLAFQAMIQAGVSIPPVTNDIMEARQWAQEGSKVVCRTIVDGHEGRGIVIATTPQEVVQAPLYTKYVKKRAEYRVHVVNGHAIAVQRKVLRKGIENPNFDVRNSANGFVFQRNNIDVPRQVVTEAINAVDAMDLYFGAVDVIWNDNQQMAYVLEVNTAPGIEGSTVQDYARAFNAL